jgi:hypothetical protein
MSELASFLNYQKATNLPVPLYQEWDSIRLWLCKFERQAAVQGVPLAQCTPVLPKYLPLHVGNFLSSLAPEELQSWQSVTKNLLNRSIIKVSNQQLKRRSCKEVETAIPTPKTCDEGKYYEYAHYVLAHVSSLYDFYDPGHGKLKYFRYKNRQKVISEAVNILANGGKKYRKKKDANTKRTRRRKRMKKERLNEFIR